MPPRSAIVLAAVLAAVLGLTGAAQPAGGDKGSDRRSAGGSGSNPVVDAEVLGVIVVHRADGSRVVFTELLTDEVIAVEVRIIRYRTVVARYSDRRLRPGRWAVALTLPKTLARGRARAQVRLQDRAGTVAWYGQPIRIPAVAG
jgi:hypothetical protein